MIDLYRRYLHWNETPDVEKWDKCGWWVERAMQPLTGFGVVIFNKFDDELRHATMLEF